MRARACHAPSRRALLGAAPILVLAAALTEARAVDAPISDDTWVSAEAGPGSRGSRPDLKAGGPGGVAYLAFDTTPLPDGVTSGDVLKATVRLHVRSVPRAGVVVVKLVLDPWSEALLDGRSVLSLLDFEAARASLGPGNAGRFVDLDVTDLARAWIDGLLPNHGIALVADGEGSFVFDSKESVRGGHEPRLEITLGALQGQDPEEDPIEITGPQGPTGPPGPPGPDGGKGSSLNPRAVALMRWQEANRTGLQFPAGAHPLSAVYEGGFIWATDFDENKVRKVNPLTGETMGSFNVGSAPANAGSDSVNLWVLNFTGGTVTRLALVDGSFKGTTAVGVGPSGIAFDGKNIFIANNVGNSVMKLSTSTGQVLATFPVVDAPRRIAYDGTDLWITCARSATVVRMGTTDGAILGTYTGFSRPIGIAFDGTKMWVANFDGATISAIRVADGVTVHTIPIGLQPFEVTFDGRAVWVTNAGSDTVTKIRASDGFVLGTYPAGDTPEGVAFDGARIWVANSGSDTLTPY